MKLNRFLALYYHSVANSRVHPCGDLSLSVDVFERQMRYLARKGFTTVPLSQFYEMLREGNRPPRTLALTFDDGFLDSWVYAHPILRKYGLCATIFVTPQLIQPLSSVRPTSAQVDIRDLERDPSAWQGHLSWAELREMVADGTFEVHSHGMSHDWCFSNGRIVDFHHPGDRYYWLQWLLRPDRKPFWLTDEWYGDAALGYPVYEHGPGLTTRRHVEDKELADLLIAHVRRHGGRGFFEKLHWREELLALAEGHVPVHGAGTGLETEEEYRSRVLWELTESRGEIESNIGVRARFFCWPNGAYNEELHRIAVEEAGYDATVTTKEWPLPSRHDLIGRVGLAQRASAGPFSRPTSYLKFISAVESRCGVGVRHGLVRMYQRAKWFLRT